MKQYEVTIKGTVIKTITVCAEDKDQAIELAHGQFTTANTDDPERYDEDVLSVREMGVARKYEVPIVYKGQSNYLITATSPESAEDQAVAMFKGGIEPGWNDPSAYESIENIGEVTAI